AERAAELASVTGDAGLQRGRDSMVAESTRGAVAYAHVRFASTGPRLDGRGESDKVYTHDVAPNCFNGAATRWSRRGRPCRCYCVRRNSFNGAATRWSRRGLLADRRDLAT